MSRRNGIVRGLKGCAIVAVVVVVAIAVASGGTARAESLPITFKGLLDVTLAGRGLAAEANVFTRGDSPFDAYGARLFAEARPTDHLQVFTQLVLRDASGIYVEGAYALYTPSPERDLHVMAGKIPWPIGTWAPRAYSNKNPLISTPLMYQYHTTLLWFDFPSSADVLLAQAGQGQYGANYGYAGPRGMVVVDDTYWDVGIVATGSLRPLEFAFGGTAGTPGWGETGIDANTGKTVLGRIGFVPAPFLRAGVSAAYGPYLNESLNSTLPPGKTGNDYHQTLFMSDLQLDVSRATVTAEAFTNTWESPAIGDLDVWGGYVESKVSVAAGLYAAARYDMQRFGDILNSVGEAHTWDRNVNRLEVGAGYRLDRGVIVKAAWQRHTALARDGVPEQQDDIVGGQLSVSF
jgi:hypothetical protein